MRSLNKQQRKLLTDWFKANEDKVGIAFDIQSDVFPYDLYARITTINDYETIVQDINRFLSDLAAPNHSFT